MEVTRLNFYELLPEIKQAITDSLFLAIDGEFSGLYTGQEVHPCETPVSYYAKVRNTSLEFLFIQFGLAAFMYNNETDKFTHKAFNFYLFPRPAYRGLPDSKFLCQASCIDFLVNHDFDFNKLFRDGIPYLSHPEELQLRDILVGVHKSRIYHEQKDKEMDKNDRVDVPTDLEMIVDDALSKIADFLNDTNNPNTTMVLGKYTGFERKLIYQELAQRYCKDIVTLETTDNHLVVVKFLNAGDRQRRESEICEREIRGVDHALGFAKVMKIISESGKWVVGHNMFLDLCHMMQRFCLPLPVDYYDFKDMLHTLLPKLFDTKVLCNTDYFKDIIRSTALVHLTTRIQEPPFHFETVEAEDGPDKGYNDTHGKHHEAGYDAYVTGMVYLGLSKYIGSLQDPPERFVLPDSHLLRNISNRLFLFKVLDTCVNLEGSDPVPDRTHVFHVTYPSTWKFYNIEDLFVPYGNGIIMPLDDGAYVSLHDHSQSENVKRNLIEYADLPYGVKIITYDEHQQRIAKKQDPMSIYHDAVYVPPTTPEVMIGVPPPRPVLPGRPYITVREPRMSLGVPPHIPAMRMGDKVPTYSRLNRFKPF